LTGISTHGLTGSLQNRVLAGQAGLVAGGDDVAALRRILG
jgi:hypothetical protein